MRIVFIRAVFFFSSLGVLLAWVALARGHYPILTTFEQALLVLAWGLRAAIAGMLGGFLVLVTELNWARSHLAEHQRRPVAWVISLGLLGLLIGVGEKEPAARWWRLGAPGELPPLQQGRPIDDAPNIVLVSVETTRRDSLSLYGYSRETSPRLQRYARGGTVFELAIAQAPETLRSMSSLLTGHLPYVIDVERAARNREDPFLAPGFYTLAERLAAVGYDTQAVVSNPYLKKANGFGQGFSHYDDAHALYDEGEAYQNLKEGVTQRAIARLDELKPPFFLWLHIPDPHHPYKPVRAGSWEEEGKDFSDLQATYAQTAAEEITRQIRQVPTLAESERSKALVYLKGRYDSEILAVDQKVDGLLRALAAHEYDDANTIVVILADHGEEFLDHGGMLHSHTLRDELLRIPLILRGPGIPAGARIPDQVSLLDVTVTLLERAGVDTSGLVGQSLEPLFHSDLLTTSDGQRTASHGANHRLSLATLGTRYIAVRSGAEKLIVAYEPYDLEPLSWLPWKSLSEMTQVAIHRKSRPDVGYWNLEEDPGETTNLLLQSKARARILYDALMETRRREPVRHVENMGSEESASGLLPEERERLRKLGYVE